MQSKINVISKKIIFKIFFFWLSMVKLKKTLDSLFNCLLWKNSSLYLQNFRFFWFFSIWTLSPACISISPGINKKIHNHKGWLILGCSGSRGMRQTFSCLSKLGGTTNLMRLFFGHVLILPSVYSYLTFCRWSGVRVKVSLSQDFF